jgi:hypothetical protein
MLPDILINPLKKQIEKVECNHKIDLVEGYGVAPKDLID